MVKDGKMYCRMIRYDQNAERTDSIVEATLDEPRRILLRCKDLYKLDDVEFETYD